MSKTSATQEFVPIERVRDGIIVLKNGELRLVLITSSLNLSLKSEDEQKGTLLQFQNMLNSLDFNVQFFIQSRRLNIKPYIELLEKRQGEVVEDLLKIQINEYIGFIKKFTDETNIMTKHFFIVVPYANPSSVQKNPFLSFGINGESVEDEKSFNTARIQLEQRAATIMQGLSRFGVRAEKLGTEEVVELFYKMFNPGEQDRPAPSFETKDKN